MLGRTFADLYAPLSVGIDAGGNAAIVWTTGERAESRAHIALPVAGDPWSAPADLPAGTEVRSVDLAVSPAGHTLVTWVNREGVFAMLDAEPARMISGAARPDGARGAIADSGAALVAITAQRGRVLSVERPPEADWLPEREVSGSLAATTEPAAAPLLADGWARDRRLGERFGHRPRCAGRRGGPARWSVGCSCRPVLAGASLRGLDVPDDG